MTPFNQDLDESNVPDCIDARSGPRPSAPGTPRNLTNERRLRKTVEILLDECHPQYQLLVDIVDTALALDPPVGWLDPDPTPAHGVPRTLPRLTVVLP